MVQKNENLTDKNTVSRYIHMHSHVFELDCLTNKLSLIEIVVIGWLVLITNGHYYVQNTMHKTDYEEHLKYLFFVFSI